MSRGIHASVITELAKNAFNMAHLISIDFVTPVYLTDFAHDLSEGGNTYSASGHLLELAQVNETSEVQVSTFTLTLSSVDQAYVAILLSENYIDREVIVERAILDSSNAIIGNPISMYKGRIEGFEMQDSGTTSQIKLTVSSHWADFDRENGRRTNHNSQQVHFSGDMGFEYASSAVKDIKWGRA